MVQTVVRISSVARNRQPAVTAGKLADNYDVESVALGKGGFAVRDSLRPLLLSARTAKISLPGTKLSGSEKSYREGYWCKASCKDYLQVCHFPANQTLTWSLGCDVRQVNLVATLAALS